MISQESTGLTRSVRYGHLTHQRRSTPLVIMACRRKLLRLVQMATSSEGIGTGMWQRFLDSIAHDLFLTKRKLFKPILAQPVHGKNQDTTDQEDIISALECV